MSFDFSQDTLENIPTCDIVVILFLYFEKCLKYKKLLEASPSIYELIYEQKNKLSVDIEYIVNQDKWADRSRAES